MTYQNNPNSDPHRPLDPSIAHRTHNTWGAGGIVLASLAALAVALGLFYFIANRGDTATATRTENLPAVTTTAPANNPPAARETTGSGATSKTTDPTGSMPAIPGQVPPPAPNR